MRLNLALFASLLVALGWTACTSEAPVQETEPTKVKVQQTPPSPHDTGHAEEENPMENPRDDLVEEEEGDPLDNDPLLKDATYTVILKGAPLNKPTGISFRKDAGATNELWVINNKDDYVIKIKNPGSANQLVDSKLDDEDTSHFHFMHYSMGIAMGASNTFGVCGENDREDHFMGPSLFSADFAIFGEPNNAGLTLGSHLDMLHNSPFCMGISHVSANKFWIFNGFYGSLDLTDFATDHGPGYDDHSDGKILRYAKGLVKRQVGVPSHLVLDTTTELLYVADTGNGRVISLDTTSGNKDTQLIHNRYQSWDYNMDQLGAPPSKGWFYEVNDAVVETVVAKNIMQRPSGIMIHNDQLWVTDNKTSKIHVFELDGTPVVNYETGLPTGSLAGITASPSGEVFFLDLKGSKVIRLDPK